jgi:hypothetical protein
MRALVKQAWGGEAHGPKTLSLTPGLPVELIEVNGDWAYVSFNGQKGFAPVSVLTTLEGGKLEQVSAKAAQAPAHGFTATCVIAYEAGLFFVDSVLVFLLFFLLFCFQSLRRVFLCQ